MADGLIVQPCAISHAISRQPSAIDSYG